MKKTSKILVPVLLALLIIASIVWYLFVYDRAFTRDTLLSQARFQDMHGNSRFSAWCYDAAYSFSGHDENVAIELANQYKGDGNYTKAELTLTTAINDSPTAELYTALCKTFVEQNKLLDAVNMLENVRDSAIKAELDTLRPGAPAVDYEAGYYSKYMDIHLSSNGNTIYYTTDGTYPSTDEEPYAGSISLPAGETTVYAIAVSPEGLVSPVTVLGYTITGIIEEVVFTDPVMEAELRGLIGADSDEIVYTNELWDITDFIVPEGVSNYDDLSLLPYLKSLTIRKQNIPTLSCLSSLANLTTLDLTGCRFPVDDLSVLASLPALTDLTLSECGLSTIAALADAPNLTHLDLNNNTIRNLEPLAPMTSLQELNLSNNAVTSLASLSSLGSLEKLMVSYNMLTDLESLGSCVKLTWIEADHNDLNTLRGMHQLPLLTHLSVDYNEISDLNRLTACTELVNLSIASNQITDLEPITGLTKLEVLDFSSNQVEYLPAWPDDAALKTVDGSYNQLASIDTLANQQNLSYVYMDYNLLTNVDAIAENFCLVQVNVYGNQIPDVDKLRDHDIIVNYDPTVKGDD